MAALAEALARVESCPFPLVAFLGPPCRTRYSDIAQIKTVMTDLNRARRITVVHGGQLPFDAGVEKTAKALDIRVFCTGAETDKERLVPGYSRTPLMLDRVDLVVAFPFEDPGSSPNGPKVKARRVYGVETADSIVAVAIQFGIPILGVPREGVMTWNSVSKSPIMSGNASSLSSKQKAKTP